MQRRILLLFALFATGCVQPLLFSSSVEGTSDIVVQTDGRDDQCPGAYFVDENGDGYGAAVHQLEDAQRCEGEGIAPREGECDDGGVLFVTRKDERIVFHGYDSLRSRWRPVDVLAFDRWTATEHRLRGAGAAATVLGGAILKFGSVFALRGWSQTENGRKSIFGSTAQGRLAQQGESAGEYELHRSLRSVGVGLSTAGGTFPTAGIPINVVGARRAKGAGFHERAEKP